MNYIARDKKKDPEKNFQVVVFGIDPSISREFFLQEKNTNGCNKSQRQLQEFSGVLYSWFKWSIQRSISLESCDNRRFKIMECQGHISICMESLAIVVGTMHADARIFFVQG